ncbi:MutS-related protein [Cohnella cholangitidis]|uniref:DNA mismatch repair proteins mutS family domain-containing protein n=1 Tax=Cohnella cholangitidis TaxID=2598458 RepID=A0A7G5C0F0_9BACL|nr:hypothetical protein [Cohnella cholangitidis]QMV42684.1 hypothetical protein FPL14_16925 [Cohnella cholangitidis]
MEYPSILFDHEDPLATKVECHPSGSLHDIHMDTIIREMLQGREEYELEPLFYDKLDRIESIRYRIEIMHEIDTSVSVDSMAAFSQGMWKVREYARYSRTLPDRDQQMKWLLDAATLYCETVMELHRVMTAVELQSQGLKRCYEWFTRYIQTASFTSLRMETNELHREFDRMGFSMTLAGGKIKISADDDDQDYCRELSRVFTQGQDDEELYEIRLSAGLHLSEVEKSLLDAIKKNNPEPFRKLRAYYERHFNFIEPSMMVFDREIQFYVTCLQYFQSLKNKGLAYCYPVIGDTREFHIRGGYDLSLASSGMPGTEHKIIGNHLDLAPNERVCVLTGPNQGGKSTFVRSLGQILHLSSIGCPVPCEEAVVFHFDRMFTHFPTQEEPDNNSGKLQDELYRLKPILDESTSDSVILLNELFFTTATHDAYAMGSHILRLLLRRGSMCLYVTHVFELANSDERIVSLVAATDEFDPNKRTFRIRRRSADGIVHASSIAEKYGLTRQRMKERIPL